MDEETDDVSAVTAGSRAALNERRLRAALRRRAAALNPPLLADASPAPGLFQSFFMGGFECSTHRRRDGHRLDLIAGTRHDATARDDYRALAGHGIRTVRDGLRWHLIETAPGRYDWSSFLPMLRAAHETGTQVIWDLCHWGWPDGIDIWSPAFIDRFARFARAAAEIVQGETGAVPFYVPINEISFWSWAGGKVAFLNPCARHRGTELKAILVRAAIAAIEAVRGADRRARFVSVEPAIHVIPRANRWSNRRATEGYNLAQYEALDLLSGRLRPELGGQPGYIDVVGVNYYVNNQWIDRDLPVAVDHPRYRPFRDLLAEVHARYDRPILVAETGIEGDVRPAWLRVIGHEVAQARSRGVPVEGLCLYPILDYPGWDDDRHCRAGLLGYAAPDGTRPVHEPLARELARQQGRYAGAFPGAGARTKVPSQSGACPAAIGA